MLAEAAARVRQERLWQHLKKVADGQIVPLALANRIAVYTYGPRGFDTAPHHLGGAGFIGSNFVHWVVENQPEVHVTVLDALLRRQSRESGH